MKKLILLLSFFLLIVVACHTKKEVAKSTPNEPQKEVVKSKTYEPTEAQLTAGKTKYADLTTDNLIKGHSIYYGVCMNCHEAKNINEFSLDEFSGILDKMARKAKLTPEEKDAVLRYAVSIKLSDSQ